MSLKYVQEHLDEAAPDRRDRRRSRTGRRWSSGSRTRSPTRFELERDPSTEVLEDFDDGGTGAAPAAGCAAYTGPEIDWMVHSHMENATQGFCNVHLTIWLGPQVRVPHFGMALGCFPQGWVYLDSVPRSYLVTDTESFDKYYEPVNERWEQVRNEHTTASSRSSAAAPSSAPASRRPRSATWRRPTSRMTDLVTELAEEHLDRWLGWVDEAEQVPAEEQAALAADDEAIRRNIAERDPANVMGDRFFGPETTQRLVRALWGGDRELPAPPGR